MFLVDHTLTKSQMRQIAAAVLVAMQQATVGGTAVI